MASPRPDLRPMKATTAAEPPTGADWRHEIKWDGMRILATCLGSATTLRTANGIDATIRFPELDALADALGVDAVVDGEVIAVDGGGRADFGLLQARMHLASPQAVAAKRAEVPVAMAIFDLLWLDGHDLCPLPWSERRRLVEDLVEPAAGWRVSPVHDDGHALLEIAREQGLEGIVSKRITSAYLPGKRSPAWLKVKVRRRQEMVVGGWWPGTGNRAGRVGSLIVGVHDRGRTGDPLVYAGKVGTGFTEHALRDYEALLGPLATPTCPFDPAPPPAIARLATWVRPTVVIEVEFAEWTADGVLRHPSHLGRRLDKDPAAVVREP